MINENLFYGWQWADKTREQLITDINGKIQIKFFSISIDANSVNTPDETGRMVMSTYISPFYSPFLIFTQSQNYSAKGVSNKYEIIIIKTNGSFTTTIARNIKPDPISNNEKIFFENEIQENRQLHPNIKKQFIKKIPEYKNYYQNILLSNQYIWVCRPSTDASNNNASYNVDIFIIKGNLKGRFS